MVKVIVVTTGLPGSGKGTFAEVAKELNIPVYVMGDIVREETLRRNLPITPENLRSVAIDLRKKEGSDAIAKRMAKKISASKECVILVDGIRSMAEIKVLEKIAKVIIVSIDAPFDIRLKRIVARGRPDDAADYLKKRDETEIGFGVLEVMNSANYVILNVGSIDEFKSDAAKILNEIISKYCK
ncbi:hypothetical protein IPA_04525 [Ignicoccus pacificus DSM 13166]|uniref:Dephospho-CoA kinase n=1 Tax=Ignicoccus pacificus DSM 13166 TaxID=940294 RepID=A0A977KAH3_9CREN|nr:hypothetical protein IPA_04525 [Ignicoccus pacificus DSM 13166]